MLSGAAQKVDWSVHIGGKSIGILDLVIPEASAALTLAFARDLHLGSRKLQHVVAVEGEPSGQVPFCCPHLTTSRTTLRRPRLSRRHSRNFPPSSPRLASPSKAAAAAPDE